MGIPTQVLLAAQREKPAWAQMQLPQLSKLAQLGLAVHWRVALQKVKLTVVVMQAPHPSWAIQQDGMATQELETGHQD